MARSCISSPCVPLKAVRLILPALVIASILIVLVGAGGSQTGRAIAGGDHVWAQQAPAAAAGVAPTAHVAGCPATPDFSFSVPDPADDSFFGFGIGPLKHEITNVSV